MTPTVSKPAELSSGVYSGDVNLFSGDYNSSIKLGAVGTPSGLSYELSLNYSSSFAIGNTMPISTGIPYGEGWNLNIPTISIETEVFNNFSESQYCTEESSSPGLIDFSTVGNKIYQEGDLYWFSPYINIPGVASGRAVFKYIDVSDASAAVFELNAFENHVEIRFNKDSWTVITADGTRYTFRTAIQSYNAPSNKRILYYDQANGVNSSSNSAKYVQDQGHYQNTGQAAAVENSIQPKQRYNLWYCDAITHRNQPFQGIHFTYKGFGKFNYFKEFTQEAYKYAAAEEFQSSTFAKEHDFSCYTELLLMKIEGISIDGLVDRLELKYDTDQQVLTNNNNEFINYNSTGNGRMDELYSYQRIFFNGTSDSTFDSGWKRYQHTKINPATNTEDVDLYNPYLSDNGYVRQAASPVPQGELNFGHSFLESPRMMTTKVYPGDVYEVRSRIKRQTSQSGNFLKTAGTFDMRIVTGDINNPTGTGTTDFSNYNENNPGQPYYSEANYQSTRSKVLYSTFNMALKWSLNYGDGDKTLSNFFSMPNIPTKYQGINFQIGPGNSDTHYGASPVSLYNDPKLETWNSYVFNWGFSGVGFPLPSVAPKIKSAASIPGNFGVGLPWNLVAPVFNYMIIHENTLNSASADPKEAYRNWWNFISPGLQGNTHTGNVPTKLDTTVRLDEFQLIRYSKNPYMLVGVNYYKVNGEVGGPVDTGLKLISQKKLEYTSVKIDMLENYDYAVGAQLKYRNDVKQVVVLLKAIREVPLGWTSDTTKLPTTFFYYQKFNNTNTTYQIDQPMNGHFGMILHKIVDNLGGITQIEFYSANDVRTRYTGSFNRKAENLNCGVVTSNGYGTGQTLTVHPIVKYILKNDEDDLLRLNNTSLSDPAHKRWYYDFDASSKVSKLTQIQAPDAIHFYNGRRMSFDVGFKKVNVYGPSLVEGGSTYVNRTEYIHYGSDFDYITALPPVDDYLFHGKLQSVKEYDVNNKIHTEKLIKYEKTLAYENGYARPNPYKEQLVWEQEYDNPGGQYEYRDYYLNLPLSITMTIPTTQTFVGPAAYPWLIIPTFSGSGQDFELPKYMEFEFYPQLATLNAPFMMNSYFIKKTEEINRTYDDYKYKQAIISGTTVPAVVNTSPNPFGGGFTNPVIYNGESTPRQLALIQTGNVQKIMDTLIVQSPLPDSTLYYFMKSGVIGYEDKIKLLVKQGNLSNLILNEFTKYYANGAFGSLQFKPESVINQQSYISDDVLLASLPLLNRRSQWGFVEALFLKNDYLSDQVVKAITATSAFNTVSFTNILSKQPQFTENAIDKIVASRSLTHSTLSTILKNQVISDANFSNIIANPNVQNVTIVEIIESGGKYPSEAVFNKLIVRTPDFRAVEIERIVAVADRQLEPGLLTALISKYGNLAFLVNFNFTGNPLDAYCNNAVQTGWDYIETKTTYEYYEADYRGTAVGRAYKVLMGLEDIPARTVSISDHFGTGGTLTVNSLRLKHEPSWQVFSVTTTSPHLPTAKDEKQYFYLFDLKNRYDRYWYNYDINDVNGVGTSFIPIVLADDLDTVMYDVRWGYDFMEAYNQGVPVIPKYDGMVKSRQYAMRTTPFQQRSITKNQRDASEKRKSEYYFYDARWTTDAYSFNLSDPDENGPVCPPVGSPPTAPASCESCVRLKYGTEDEFLSELPFNYCLWKDPVIGYFACPSSINYALCHNGVELIACNPAIPEDDEPGGPSQMIILTDALKRVLQLRSTIVQVDNVMGAVSPDFTDHRIDRSNTEIADFYITFAGTDPNGFFRRFQMVFPYDTLTTLKVLRRNQHTQPTLISNSVGLKTKFYYNSTINKWNYNPNCQNPNYNFLYNYSSVVTTNVGLPVRVTVGYGRPDSLGTDFDYTNDGQVKKMVSASGHMMEYAFDGLNRLTSVTENGTRLLSRNQYNLWKHDFGLPFQSRANENSVYSVFYQNNTDTLNTREFQKSYVDPMGRSYGTVRAYEGEGNQQVHSGIIAYDNWGRPISEFKPWKKTTTGTGNLIPFDPNNNTSSAGLNKGTKYENDPRSVDMLHSDFGISISNTQNPLIRKSTCITNAIFMSCELRLNNSELQQVMNAGGTGNYRFTRVSIIDQDGKETVIYTNAMGQTVGTLSWQDYAHKVVTLFIYDSYGNLSKTINALRQPTEYQYNILGQLIREKNVDGGEKRYIYNKHGKISAIQDQSDRNNKSVLNIPEPRYRKFEYDIYGNMTEQYLVANSFQIDPFCFANKNTGSPGDEDYFEYVFSDRMTQDWLNNYKTSDPLNVLVLEAIGVPVNGQYGFIITEKTMNYGVAQTSPSTLGKLTKSYSYATAGNAHGAPVQEILYTYNTEDLLASQTIKQHPLDIAISDQFSVSAVIHYSGYNFRGSLLEQKLDMDGNGIIDMKYFYQYDALNRLQEVHAAQGDVSIANATKMSSYSYDDARGTVFKKSIHGESDYDNGTTTQMYDNRDRLSVLFNPLFTEELYYDDNTLPTYAGSSVDQDNTFNGNVKGVRMTYNFSSANNSTTGMFNKPTIYGYEYDGLNRLINADAIVGDFVDAHYANSSNLNQVQSYSIGDELWRYDRIGNIINQYRIKPGAQSNIGTLVDDFTYTYANGTNRLIKVEDPGVSAIRNYTYDANGNLLTDDSKGISATGYVRGSYAEHLAINNDHAYYLYSGSDLRIAKKVVTLAQTTHEMYIKDALGRDLAIVKFVTNNSTNNTVKSTEYFVYGTDRVARVISVGGEPKIRVNEATFFLYDHLGNTRVAFSVNAQDVATISNAVDYYSYGKILREYDNGAGDSRYLTTQHERDQETGLDYRGARYYDSDVARFLSLDPLAVKYPMLSAYNYVAGNPIVFIDPDGKEIRNSEGKDISTKKHQKQTRWTENHLMLNEAFGDPSGFNRTIASQIQNRPSWDNMYKNYPMDHEEDIDYDQQPEQVFSMVFGSSYNSETQMIEGNIDASNACATRLSVALVRSGVRLAKDMLGQIDEFKGKGIIISAVSMAKFLSSDAGLGAPDHRIEMKGKTFDDLLNVLEGKVGIYVMTTRSGMGYTGHCSLWNGQNCIGDNNYAEDAGTIYFWELE
ncbi:T6SS effector amidase Tae4 family protein [Fluviicola sp.]